MSGHMSSHMTFPSHFHTAVKFNLKYSALMSYIYSIWAGTRRSPDHNGNACTSPSAMKIFWRKDVEELLERIEAIWRVKLIRTKM